MDVWNARRLPHLPGPNAPNQPSESQQPFSLKIVLKLGTTNICDDISHRPLLATLSKVVETCVKLREAGHHVVLVSSGAIGTGLRTLDLEKKPQEMAKKQVFSFLLIIVHDMVE